MEASSEAAVTLRTEALDSAPNPQPSFPMVQSGMPAMPGAPPEVLVEDGALSCQPGGLFYFIIDSAKKTILTDFLVASFGD